MGGREDHEIGEFAQAKDFALVTKNSVHFRGKTTERGATGVYSGVALHAGLVCLNGPVGMNLRIQNELFDIALDELAIDADLANMALEITLENPTDEAVTIHRYPIPGDGPYALDAPKIQKQMPRATTDR